MRESARGLYISSLLAVLGFIANRLNVSITALEGAQGGHYVPAWSEVMITLMLIAIGFGAFSLAVRYLNVYPSDRESIQDPTPAPARLPARETASSTSLGTPIHNYGRIRKPMRPVWLRCSSVIYPDITHSSRLASRAPRLSRCVTAIMNRGTRLR